MQSKLLCILGCTIRWSSVHSVAALCLLAKLGINFSLDIKVQYLGNVASLTIAYRLLDGYFRYPSNYHSIPAIGILEHCIMQWDATVIP